MSPRTDSPHLRELVVQALRPAAEVCADEGHTWSIVEVYLLDQPGPWPLAITCDRHCGHPGFRLVGVSV